MDQVLKDIINKGIASGLQTLCEAYYAVISQLSKEDIEKLHGELLDKGLILGGEQYDWVDPYIPLKQLV